MISYIDPILFPDQCHVYEIAQGRYVYPIYKNGSSSLAATGRQINYRELEQVRTVEVFLRDPFERYVSGVQTYLRNLDPAQDRATVLSMISEFLFLNRHFTLQFHWLMNLARHSDAWMQFRSMDELGTATEHVLNVLERDETLIKYFTNNNKLQYYLLLDKIVYEKFMGKTVSFKQVVQYIKDHEKFLYNEIIQRSKDLCNVLD
jgi:hypothetical protein